MNRLLVVAAALALPIAVTGCNSSSTKPSSLDTTTATPTPTPTTPSATPAAGDDKARVAAIQMSLADLPSGWKSQPITTSSAEMAKGDARFDACLGVPTIDSVRTAESEVNFGRSDGFAFAGTIVNATHTDAQALPYLTALSGPKAVQCSIAETRREPPPKGATLVNVTGSQLTMTGTQFGFRTTTTYRLSNGRNASVTTDEFGVVVKRFVVQVDFTGVIQPVQQSLESELTAKVIARATVNAA